MALFTQDSVHLVESSSLTMKATTIGKGRMKTTSGTLLNEDGRELADGTSARCTSTNLVIENQCFWYGSTHASMETTSKHLASAENHNRCVVDAGRFSLSCHRHFS